MSSKDEDSTDALDPVPLNLWKLVIQWLPVSSSIWNCCQVAQPMTILSGAECVDPKDGFRDSSCSSMNHPKGSLIDDIKDATLSLETSPTASPQPLLPLLAPSPLAPFTNSTSPKLSGMGGEERIRWLIEYFPLVKGSLAPHIPYYNCKGKTYVSHLQRQSFVTNLQALDCAASLRLKLQKGNVSKNVYDLCCISLKDFSVQVATEGNVPTLRVRKSIPYPLLFHFFAFVPCITLPALTINTPGNEVHRDALTDMINYELKEHYD
ncbi:hypothetical protein T459_11335 [Capsicum annuum]|uniref:At1g61900-like C-terminal domain-containing protein n=1 Tax=Capsicum annuum TaxID=4072 RepID=A0A2G2ZLN1_CAPAN|nr:hypothetical protein T459_11335 [Capsicum annuum]